MWKLGPRNSFSGNICFEFSVKYLWSGGVLTLYFLYLHPVYTNLWMECEAAVYDVHEESNVLWMSEIAGHSLEHSRYQPARYRTQFLEEQTANKKLITLTRKN
jgi:hypothetical protein